MSLAFLRSLVTRPQKRAVLNTDLVSAPVPGCPVVGVCLPDPSLIPRHVVTVSVALGGVGACGFWLSRPVLGGVRAGCVRVAGCF